MRKKRIAKKRLKKLLIPMAGIFLAATLSTGLVFFPPASLRAQDAGAEIAVITSPSEGSLIGDTTLEIRGSARGVSYTVFSVMSAFISDDYGYPVSSYTARIGSGEYVEDGVLATFDTSALNGNVLNYYIWLKVITQDNTAVHAYVRIYYDPAAMAGWPNKMGNKIIGNPICADMDGDGDNEILAVEWPGTIHLWNTDGSAADGWPMENVVDGGYLSSPTVTDLDGNGDKEIIVATNYFSMETCRMLIINHDKTDFGGFPLTGTKRLHAPFVIYDIDYDGVKEIIFYHKGSSVCKVFAFKPDGTTVPGSNWPFEIESESYAAGGIAVADYNGDGLAEVIFSMKQTDAPANIYVLDMLANVLQQIDVDSEGYRVGPPSLADVDNDGDMEMFLGIENEVYGLDHEGNVLEGWPVSYDRYPIKSEVILADIDFDSDLEITFITFRGSICVRDYDGTEVLRKNLPGDRYGVSINDYISVADIHGDGTADIISGNDRETALYAFNSDGVLLGGFPKKFGKKFTYEEREAINRPPLLTDMDLDGDIEIITVTDKGYLCMWDLDAAYNEAHMEWPQHRFDEENTGGRKASQPPANRKPIITQMNNRIIFLDETVRIQVDARDPDGNTLYYSQEGLTLTPADSFGADTGLLEWTPGMANIGDHAVTFRVRDRADANDLEIEEASVEMSITVNDRNRAPSLQAITPGQRDANEDEVFSLTVTGSDTNAGDTLTISMTGAPSGATLTKIDNENARFTWTPGSSDIGVPQEIYFKVADQDGLESAQQQLNLSVIPVTTNLPPVLGDIGSQNLTEGTEHTFTIHARDENRNDTVTYSIYHAGNIDHVGGETRPLDAIIPNEVLAVSTLANNSVRKGDPEYNPEADFDGNDMHSGLDILFMSTRLFNKMNDPANAEIYPLQSELNAMLDPTSGRFTWTPEGKHGGSQYFTFVATDSRGATDAETVSITVTELPNNPPVITGIDGYTEGQTINEMIPLSLTVRASDPDNDPLTYSIIEESRPDGASIEGATGAFSWMPTYEQGGTSYSITFKVSDGEDFVTRDVNVGVNDVNRAPTLAEIPDQNVAEGDTVSITPVAGDPDNDTLYYSQTGLPNANDFNPSTGAITWITDNSDVRTDPYSITITVRDRQDENASDVLTATQTVAISVIETPNNRPTLTLTPSGDQAVSEGDTVSITCTGEDPDGDTLYYSQTGLPDPNDFSATTGAISWLTDSDEGRTEPYSVTITVRDRQDANAGDVLTASETVSITINNVNRAPVFTETIEQQYTTTEGSIFGFSLAASDPDGDSPLYFSYSGLPDRVFLPATGILLWTRPYHNEIGTYSAVFSVADRISSDPDRRESEVKLSTTIKVIPKAPTNPSTRTVSSSQIDLEWNYTPSPSNATYNDVTYEIERGTAQAGPFVKIDDNPAGDKIYGNTGLTPDTTYYYRVRAVIVKDNSTYRSEYCSVVNATTPGEGEGERGGENGDEQPDGAPSAPANLVVTEVYTNRVVLTWDDTSSIEERFEIERRMTNEASFTMIEDNVANFTTCTDLRQIQPDTIYYYRVRAMNNAGNSDYSNIVRATTLPRPPSAPYYLTLRAGSQTQMDLQWRNIENETGFEVERGTAEDGPFSKIGDNEANDITYSDTGLTPATTYYYRVSAVNRGGKSGYCRVESAATPPSAPVNLSAIAVSKSEIDLTWTDAGSESGYRVEANTRENGQFPYKTLDLPANVTTYRKEGLRTGRGYYFRVAILYDNGDTEYSNVVWRATHPNPPDPDPSELSATTVSSTQIDLAWRGCRMETSYEIERGLSENGPFVKIQDNNMDDADYSDTGLTPDTAYYYRVCAVNLGGKTGYSNVANAITYISPPTAPAGLSATVISSSQIDLTWTDASDNEAKFEIERRHAGPFANAADNTANDTTYSDTGLTPSVTYHYRVRAVNQGGNSMYSSSVEATTLPNAPGAPTNLLARTISPRQIDLTWGNISNETGYEIERGSAQTGPFTKIADNAADDTNYSDMGLTPGTTYYYRVRAVTQNVNSEYSNTTDTTTAPHAPTNLAAVTISPRQIDLTWTDASDDETSFEIMRGDAQAGPFHRIASNAANDTTYSNEGGFPRGITYYYMVRAVSRFGESDYSSVANATIPPNTPSHLSAEAASKTQIDLTWRNSGINTSYEIERGNAHGGPFTEITDTPVDDARYSDTGLALDTTYYYRVRAVNQGGRSEYSNIASTTTLPNVPAAPSLSTQALSQTQIRVTWGDLSDETGYEIERGNAQAGPFTKIADNAANDITYSDTGLTPDATYYYRVRAVNRGGNSGYSNVAHTATFSTNPADIAAAAILDRFGKTVTADDVTNYYPASDGSGTIVYFEVNKTSTTNRGRVIAKVNNTTGAVEFPPIFTRMVEVDGSWDNAVMLLRYGPWEEYSGKYMDWFAFTTPSNYTANGNVNTSYLGVGLSLTRHAPSATYRGYYTLNENASIKTALTNYMTNTMRVNFSENWSYQYDYYDPFNRVTYPRTVTGPMWKFPFAGYGARGWRISYNGHVTGTLFYERRWKGGLVKYVYRVGLNPRASTKEVRTTQMTTTSFIAIDKDIAPVFSSIDQMINDAGVPATLRWMYTSSYGGVSHYFKYHTGNFRYRFHKDSQTGAVYLTQILPLSNTDLNLVHKAVTTAYPEDRYIRTDRELVTNISNQSHISSFRLEGNNHIITMTGPNGNTVRVRVDPSGNATIL